MQRVININQEAIFRLVGKESKLDITDFAILGYIVDFCGSTSGRVGESQIVDKEGKVWTWIDLGTIIKENPLLKINTRSSISTRIKGLVKEGFISTMNKRMPVSHRGGAHTRMYFRPERNTRDLVFTVNSDTTSKTESYQGGTTSKTESYQGGEGGTTSKTEPTKYNTSNGVSSDKLGSKKIEFLSPSGGVEDDQSSKKIDIFEVEEIKAKVEKKEKHVTILRAVAFFKPINKDWRAFYNSGFQREAIKKLIRFTDEDGIKIETLVEKALSLHGVPYAPQVFSPQDMVYKYDKLVKYSPKPLVKETPPGGAPYTKGKFADKKDALTL